MKLVKIGVVRGGVHNVDYQKSISSGAILLRALRENKNYIVSDILIDKDEVWHIDGLPIKPAQLIPKVDICISTLNKPLHKGGYVESILRSLGVRCIHSPKSALKGYIPENLKSLVESIGLRLPERLEFSEFTKSLYKQIHHKFAPPYVLSIVNSFGETEFLKVLKDLNEIEEILISRSLEQGEFYLLEEYISGDEWSVSVMPNFRDNAFYVLHPFYVDTFHKPFFKNQEFSPSAKDKFANVGIREHLTLYSRLMIGVMPDSVPRTFVFRHLEGKNPVLIRIKEHYLLNEDEHLLNSLKESNISQTEFLDFVLDNHHFI